MNCVPTLKMGDWMERKLKNGVAAVLHSCIHNYGLFRQQEISEMKIHEMDVLQYFQCFKKNYNITKFFIRNSDRVLSTLSEKVLELYFVSHNFARVTKNLFRYEIINKETDLFYSHFYKNFYRLGVFNYLQIKYLVFKSKPISSTPFINTI